MGHEIADHAAERHRRDRRLRSRTACAAASASRCARRTCRAPTCSTARATRSSRPRCWSRPSCTRSRRGAACRIKHLDEFERRGRPLHRLPQVPESPCPVDIDFGDVSMNMRNLLRKMGKKRFRPGNAAAMLFLNATDPETIKLMRTAMIDIGLQGAARSPTTCCAGLGASSRPRQPPATRRHARRSRSR